MVPAAFLTLRSELLDFVRRYPASCRSKRDLRSFFGEVNQMLDFAGILLSGPYTLGFFESQTGFFQSNRGAPDDSSAPPCRSSASMSSGGAIRIVGA